MTRYQIGSGYIELDDKGRIIRLESWEGRNILAESGPLFRLGAGGKVLEPLLAQVCPKGLRFGFDGGRSLDTLMEQKDGYLRITVTRVEGGGLENIMFGPVLTSLDETIGDVVGVVQGGGTVLGVTALNIMTLPGFPREYPLPPATDSGRVLSLLSVDAFSIYDSAA